MLIMSKVQITVWECFCDNESCGHSWKTKTYELPKVCPKCKSVKWDKNGDIESIEQTGDGEPVVKRKTVVAKDKASGNELLAVSNFGRLEVSRGKPQIVDVEECEDLAVDYNPEDFEV